jgi:hypothetical protein
MAHARRRDGIAEAAAKGALAGVAGGMVMMMAIKMEQQALLPEGAQAESPPKKVVETMAERAGVELPEPQATAVAMGAHLEYGAMWRALYGILKSRLRVSPALLGLVYGELIYALNYPSWGLLPRLGVQPPPSQQPLAKAAIPVGAHAIFGLATAAAYETLS